MVRLLSTVIPVWNRKELVGDAIASVLAQELPPGWKLELIVVDDGSDDGTAEYLDARAGRSLDDGAAVRVVHTAHCGYPGAARNRGVREASGELVAFLDSDDRWLPGKLLAQIPLHRPTGAGSPARLSHTREIWVRNGHEVSQRTQRHRRDGDILTDALVKCIVGPSTVMIDTELYRSSGGFREDIEVAEDYEYWLRLLARTPVSYLDEPFTVKQAGEWEQLSEKYGEIERFRITALRDLVVAGFFRDAAGRAASAAARTELARKLRVYAAGARKRGRSDEADDLTEEADTFENNIPDL